MYIGHEPIVVSLQRNPRYYIEKEPSISDSSVKIKNKNRRKKFYRKVEESSD